MKFKYYIVDSDIGTVFGTNSDAEAEEIRKSETHYVINSEEGVWLLEETEDDIQEQTKP